MVAFPVGKVFIVFGKLWRRGQHVWQSPSNHNLFMCSWATPTTETGIQLLLLLSRRERMLMTKNKNMNCVLFYPCFLICLLCYWHHNIAGPVLLILNPSTSKILFHVFWLASKRMQYFLENVCEFLHGFH